MKVSDQYIKIVEWSEEESKKLEERLDTCTKAIQSFGFSGMAQTMSNFNNK